MDCVVSQRVVFINNRFVEIGSERCCIIGLSVYFCTRFNSEVPCYGYGKFNKDWYLWNRFYNRSNYRLKKL